MFGFLKNLLQRKPADDPAALNPEPQPQFEAEAPAPDPTPAPRPAPQRQSPRQQQSSAFSPPTRGNGKGIEVPLQKILTGLPLELQPRVLQGDVGQLAISIPLDKVLAQLPTGAVKVPFGELRMAAPGVFSPETDRDRVLVALPLQEIIARLNPTLITRRRVQRQVEVPADISSPFDGNGENLLSVGPNKSEPSRPAPRAQRQTTPSPSAPAPARSGIASVPPAIAPQATPVMPKEHGTTPPTPPPFRNRMPAAPAQPTPPPAPLAPSAPIPGPAVQFQPPKPAAPPPPAPPIPFQPAKTVAPPSHNTAAPFQPQRPVAPPSHNTAAPFQPQRPVAPPSSAVRANPTPSNAPLRLSPELNGEPAHTAQPAPTKPANEPPALMVGITALAEAWPDSVRKEIVLLNLVDAKVALPFATVEQALKNGRITFSWKTIRSWVRPPIQVTASPYDGMVMELPLKVVAPLFLARQREASKEQQKVAIDEEIPNLFFGFPQAEPSASPPTPSDTNYYVWDDASEMVREDESAAKRGPSPGTKFVAKYATPNEIVSRASSLDGVAGALIALPDGLMVASRLSADLNGDTVAAFLPQIFGKVSQCTKELRMGDLNNLNFTVGNIPWKIFRVNAIFFAAFGRAGAPLPTAQLAALAAELDHKPK